MDKAGKEYWDNSWASVPINNPIDPYAKGLNNYINRNFHNYFTHIFTKYLKKPSINLLEVGCANSVWLPYFAKEFCFNVCGIDYSENGCIHSKRILEQQGIAGEIVLGDFFNPPKEMYKKFDVVVSFGVVEHFQETAECLKALRKYLKPGGIIITVIPNMAGLIGTLQRILNKKIYDIHVPLNLEDIVAEHEAAGFEIKEATYFLIANFCIININNLMHKKLLYKILLKTASISSKILWILDYIIPIIKPNRFLSPYIICVAQNGN